MEDAARATKSGAGREQRALLTFPEFFAQEFGSVAKALYLVVDDVSEAEDLAEEAFARAWARWDRVGALASPAGYVYRTALNLHRNRLRRVARELRHRRAPEAPADPAEEVSELDDLRRALASLPPGQREAVVLVEWFGFTVAEAAAVLRIKPGSVRVRLSRARAALARWTGDRDE